MAVGELLLDQGVLAGLGNVYRCEALFLERLDPWATRALVGPDGVRRLVTLAQQLIRASSGIDAPPGREVGPGRPRPFVYGRAGRPCRRCATTIRSARLGFQARSVSWCPTCQSTKSSGADDSS